MSLIYIKPFRILTDIFVVKVVLLSQIENWNALIRSGEGKTVARELKKLSREQIPEDLLAPVANIAWRVNQAPVALRLLYPHMKRCAQLKVPVAPEAQAEFAGCLLEIGATSESKHLLQEITNQSPRAKFYQALLAFKEWDYEQACPLLENYLETLPPSYHRLVVQVNLASAYVTTSRISDAEPLIRRLHTDLETGSHTLLRGNVFEIESQIFFKRKEFTQALRCLDEGEQRLRGAQNMGWLYCKKWQLINRIMQDEKRQRARYETEFADLRTKAQEMASWETIRELDVYWGLAFRDQARLAHAYFGSPQRNYRERLRELMKEEKVDLQNVENFLLGSVRAANVTSLSELLRPDTESLGAYLPKKLLLILLSDFYAPFRTGQLFSLIFEGEHYDPETSPDKVIQIVRRLRQELQPRFKAEIEFHRQGYHLRLAPEQAIVINGAWVHLPNRDRATVFGQLIHEHFRGAMFSSNELAEWLNVSTRTANRILKNMDESSLKKIGQGRSSRFQLNRTLS